MLFSFFCFMWSISIELRISRSCQALLCTPSSNVMMAASPSALDIVLSCSICQAPFSSIYVDPDQNNGLRKGDDPLDGRTTRLWLTECTHLICSDHFDGGGQQFPFLPCTHEAETQNLQVYLSIQIRSHLEHHVLSVLQRKKIILKKTCSTSMARRTASTIPIFLKLTFRPLLLIWAVERILDSMLYLCVDVQSFARIY